MTRWTAVSVLILSSLAAATPVAWAADSALSVEANAAFLANNARQPGMRQMRDGLQYKILKSGFGQNPTDADVVTVYYSLSLINGKRIQGTEPDFPAQFEVTNLIPGWQEAVKTMRVGDRWKVYVPASLGYGPRGTADGMVPPNQTLVFDMELIKVFTPPPRPKKEDGQGGPGQ